eukprot:m.109137 g.109137  ORF g.109137 m.109137 type:complete len:451 (+) comp13365_c0_seq1:78-1430(+)
MAAPPPTTDDAILAQLAEVAKEQDCAMDEQPDDLPELDTEQKAKVTKALQFMLNLSKDFALHEKNAKAVSESLKAMRKQHELAQRRNSVQLLGKVYVGNISFELNDSHLREAFRPFGYIYHLSLNKEMAGGKHKGFAFVEYDAPEAAVLAIELMNGVMLGSRPLKLGRPTMAPQQSPLLEAMKVEAAKENRIYIASINFDIAADDIKGIFEMFGTIKRIALAAGTEGRGNHRGYGWLEYDDASVVDEAVASLNNFELGGQFLRVCRAMSDPDEIAAFATVTAPQGPAPVAQAFKMAQAVAPAEGTKTTLHHEENISISGSTQRYLIMQKLAEARTGGEACIVRLKNMLTVGEIDEEFEADVKDECSKHGKVTGVSVLVNPADASPSSMALVYVTYDDVTAASAASKSLNGRFFGGHTVAADTMTEESFQAEKAGLKLIPFTDHSAKKHTL